MNQRILREAVSCPAGNRMVVKGKDLKRLLRGAVITLEFDRDLGWHAGRTYAVQTKGGRPQIARMLCREWWGEDGLWFYRVELSREVPPEWMASRSEMGYTHDHHRALDPEAEVVPDGWLRDHLEASHGQTRLTRGQEVERRLLGCRTFEERLVTLRNLARTHRVDVRSEFRLIDQLRRDGKLSRVERLASRVEDRVRKEAA